jgi:ribosomal protein S27E
MGYPDSIFGRSIDRGTPMQIIAKCPKCCRTWQLESSAADRRIRCRSCGTLFKVPKSEEVPKAAEVIKQTKGTVYVDEAGRAYG